MGTIENLRLRAERSRRHGADAPLVATVEEARALARSVAEGLAAASDQDRLLLLSNLHEVQAALSSRLSRLDGEIGDARARIAAVNRGLSAHAGYSPRLSPRGDSKCLSPRGDSKCLSPRGDSKCLSPRGDGPRKD